MDHQHHHSHTHNDDIKNLKIAFFLNFLFSLLELVGGLLTNSMAILSDALHDFGDSLSIGLSWYFQNFSKKSADEQYTYGYRRFSLISALVNSFVLFAGSVFIIREAIPRLLDPEPVHSLGMLGLAILGILFNGIAILRLHKGSSVNERMVKLHLLEDVLGWIAVLVGSLLIYFFDWTFLDPLLSMGIAAFILWNVFKNFKQIVGVFLQAIPSDVDINGLIDELSGIEGVRSVSDVHIWSLDGEFHILSAHLGIEDTIPRTEIETLKARAREIVKRYHIEHETFEIGFSDRACMFRC